MYIQIYIFHSRSTYRYHKNKTSYLSFPTLQLFTNIFSFFIHLNLLNYLEESWILLVNFHYYFLNVLWKNNTNITSKHLRSFFFIF